MKDLNFSALRLELRAAVTRDGVGHAHVLEQLGHHVHQACCSPFSLVDIEPPAEAVHHHTEVVPVKSKVVATNVLEQVCRYYGLWGGMSGWLGAMVWQVLHLALVSLISLDMPG
jgi:hypothetical protein